MEADQAHAALTALHGIGPWTADIYLLFCLGHADAWPAGDLALQEAARIAFGLQEAARRQGDGEARRKVAAVARGGRASALGLLSCGEAARGRAGTSQQWPAVTRKQKANGAANGRLNSTARGWSRRAARRKRLVVFLHGYGADGNDLIDIGRAWQGAAARHRLRLAACAGAVRPGADRAGNGFRSLTAHPNERWDGVDKAAPGAGALPRCRTRAPQAAARRRWRWSASARAP